MLTYLYFFKYKNSISNVSFTMKYFFSMSLKGFKLTLIIVIMLSPSSCQITNNELINSDSYKAFLNDIISPSKLFKRSEDSSCLNKIQNGTPGIQESAYERVIRNLRRNWEMPVDYLQKRGYLTKLDPKRGSQSNDLSMDAYNLINGPLLNPSTFKNVYPLPNGPNSFPSIKTARSDQSDNKNKNNVANSVTKTRSSNENLLDCSNPSMNNDLACLDQYLGENWAKSVKDKWQTWFHKNQSITTTSTVSTTTINFPITTTSPTTISPSTMSSNPNQTSEVISDLSIQDAQDRLEFFKIYNDFILAKLASKLSQNEHERQMLNSAQNTDQNTLPVATTNPADAPFVPDFSNISDNDIQVLKDLESCLKNKKNLTNLEGNVPVVQSIDDTLDVTDDRRVNNTYLPTKLKFLAHLHHEVFDIGHKKSLRKDQSKILLNANDSNVDVANIGNTNYTYFTVK